MDVIGVANAAIVKVYAQFWWGLDGPERGGGGDGGIRTLDTRYQVWLLSRELVSATHPRLRMSHGPALPVARGAL